MAEGGIGQQALHVGGDLFFQKCRDVVWVPKVEVRIAEIFEGVGKSRFGGDEIKSVCGWEVLGAVFEGLQNVGANRGRCPFAFDKESLPGFGVEGDEVYFALSVPPASDSVKVEGSAIVKIEFKQEFSRDIFKGKAHKFRYAGIEAIEKIRKIARFVDTQLTVDESHPESDKGVADFIATFFCFPGLLANGHFAFDEVKQVGQFAQVFGQASGWQSDGAGDFRAAGFSRGDGFEDCQIGVGSATKFGENDIAHLIAKGGKGGEQCSILFSQ